jgi:putative sterol carrier protein
VINVSELEDILSGLLDTANKDPGRKETLGRCMGQTIQLKVTDGEDLVIVADQGKLSLKKGTIPNPTATVMGEEQHFIDLFNQELDPMGATMSGKLVLKGDVTPFMELNLF